MRSLFSERVHVHGRGIVPAALLVEDGRIVEIKEGQQPAGALDLGDHLLMPGLVDLHGDSFERQLMPKPGLLVDPLAALIDTDAQLLANGITTGFHGVVWSWESGLRSPATGRRWMQAIRRHPERLGADHRIHLCFEAYAGEALDEALALIEAGWIDLLAFNDHTPDMLRKLDDDVALSLLAQRGQVSVLTLKSQLTAVRLSATGLAKTTTRLIEAANARSLPMLSHDDRDADQRRAWRARGVRVCEFPIHMETAADAIRSGDAVVAGAPDIVRGGSRLGWVTATELVAAGHCTALVSDYWYPALLHAPWRLARDGILPLAQAIALVTSGPADLAAMPDRGRIAPDMRADLILVDDCDVVPRVAIAWVAGRKVLAFGQPA